MIQYLPDFLATFFTQQSPTLLRDLCSGNNTHSFLAQRTLSSFLTVPFSELCCVHQRKTTKNLSFTLATGIVQKSNKNWEIYFKASDQFILIMYQSIMHLWNGSLVVRNPQNYNPSLHFPSALQGVLVSFSWFFGFMMYNFAALVHSHGSNFKKKLVPNNSGLINLCMIPG